MFNVFSFFPAFSFPGVKGMLRIYHVNIHCFVNIQFFPPECIVCISSGLTNMLNAFAMIFAKPAFVGFEVALFKFHGLFFLSSFIDSVLFFYASLSLPFTSSAVEINVYPMLMTCMLIRQDKQTMQGCAF